MFALSGYELRNQSGSLIIDVLHVYCVHTLYNVQLYINIGIVNLMRLGFFSLNFGKSF